MKPVIEQMIAGEDGWSDWIHPLPGYLLQCCDCGLIHDAEFQIGVSNNTDTAYNPGEGEDGVVIFRMRRNESHRFADWRDREPESLERAIAEFKRDLPGWWFSVGECEKSCDASAAPTRDSPHIDLVGQDSRFNDGFHADLQQPSTLAEALDDVRSQAMAALKDIGA